MNYDEEFDKLKTKVLKYVLYKKRTEMEVKQKFCDELNQELLEVVVEYLKEQDYIDDEVYIEKAINEFIKLNNLSIKEVKYKLLSKGIKSSNIENYISYNKEKLLEYEKESAKKIFIKKESSMEKQDIIAYLNKKGYLSEIIKLALEEI